MLFIDVLCLYLFIYIYTVCKVTIYINLIELKL